MSLKIDKLPDDIMLKLKDILSEKKWTKAGIARSMNMPGSTFGDIFNGGNVSRKSLGKIKTFLNDNISRNLEVSSDSLSSVENVSKSQLVKKSQFLKETSKRTEKLRHMLLLLEKELGEFRDDSPEARDALRALLDINDIGYIACLLTMICDEDKFQRWMLINGIGKVKFNSFKKGNKPNE